MTAAQGAVRIPVVEVPRARGRGLGSLELLGPAGRIALPLAGVEIVAKVAGAVAEVQLSQRFQNPHTEPLEAEYVFPLPGGAAVSRFELKVAGRTVVGQVQERGEARRNYAEAIQQGKRAALLEQERGDVFTVSVGNLPPGEEAQVLISWSERLPVFEDGAAELRLPLVVAPRYIAGTPQYGPPAGGGTAEDTDKVPDASRLTPPRLAPGFDPNVALSIKVELLRGGGTLDDLCCSQHAVRQQGGPEAVKIELAREGELLDRDFVLRWRMAGAKVEPQLLFFRPPEGEAFGLLTLLPPRREGFLGLPRDVVFVLDRSGSMGGAKMIWAARACAQLLRTLGPRDRFCIQAFDDHVEWLERKDHSRWLQADEPGLEAGEKYLHAVTSRGGTELDLAMREALAQISARAAAGDAAGIPAAGIPVVVLLTDGQIGDESSVLRRLQLELGEARVFTVGIDTAVNAAFLTRLAAIGGGTASFVEPGARLEEALRAVGREIGSPLVTGLSVAIEGGAGGLPEGALAPEQLPDLFAGRPAAAFLKLKAPVTLKISGTHADGSAFTATVAPQEVPLPALAQLWAKARVGELEDQFRLRQAGEHGAGTTESIAKEIVAIALRHVLLTRFTAFVAIDQEVVNAGGKGRKVVQPVQTPQGWEQELPPGGGGFVHASMAIAPMGGAPVMPAPSSPPAMPSAPRPMRQRAMGAVTRSLAATLGKVSDAFGGGYGAGGTGSDAAGPADSLSEGDASAEDAKAAAPGPRSHKRKGGPPMGRPIPMPPLPRPQPMPPRQSEVASIPDEEKRRLHAALEQLATALETARAALAAGKPAEAAPVEAARTALLKLLATSAAASSAGALQRLLRSGLAELVAALRAPGTPIAALLALCQARQRELVAARAALDAALGGAAPGPGAGSGAFWQASI